ncbi:MAG: hypothetical protein EZS28_026575 [Streblomastix strix]|uniref:Uncharacterized protein n=1 Tax=Streblomastix strix TaxID=222440 RepID=A0A5J4V6E2_9EUKA|nr:MAG: hypothetical protein EZS28_026575 [Streblomastix strix]
MGELARQTHFRGYYLLNADIINLASSATGDFAFSAESGTVWMYESSWYDNGQLVPDQVTPASDSTPLVDGTASAGISTSYSRGDHVHPQQLNYDGNVTATKFIKTDGTNQQILLADGTNKSITDFNTSVAPRAYQIDPADGIYWLCFAVLNIPNYTSNGSYGCTIDINTTYVTDLFYQIKWNLRIQNGYNRRFEATQLGQTQTDFMICADTPDRSLILRFYMKVLEQAETLRIYGAIYSNNGVNQLGFITVKAGQEGQSSGLQINAAGDTLNFYGKVNSGNIQLNPTAQSYYDGLRIANTTVNSSAIYIGTSTSTTGWIEGQFAIIKRADGTLTISRFADQNTANRGLVISADGNTLTFNGSVIAGTGATNGATNGSVNYSAGNPILWGVNSVGTEGGFYSDGAKVYWRAKPITLGSVPP